jgi:hypothetical protein
MNLPFPPGPSFSPEKNWQGANLFSVEENEFSPKLPFPATATAALQKSKVPACLTTHVLNS